MNKFKKNENEKNDFAILIYKKKSISKNTKEKDDFITIINTQINK